MKKLLLSAAILTLGFGANTALAQRYLQADFISQIKVTNDTTYARNFSVLTGTPTLIPLRMDVYEPVGDPNTLLRPLVIYLHTGSFLPQYINGQVTGSRKDSTVSEMCRQFAKRGYVAVAASYRTGWAPTAVGAAGQDIRTGTLLNAVYRAILDAKSCVRYFKQNATVNNNGFKIDTNKIILVGQGSGGYVSLAYATLDKVSEINLSKFISSTTNVPFGLVAGNSYINQAALGGFNGEGGIPQLNSLPTTNQGYSSKVQMAINFGGAIGDSSWLEAGDVPMACAHVKTDPFAPYNFGQVIVPTTGDFVVNVSGSKGVVSRANRLGNNNVINALTFVDPFTVRADQINEGIKNLFPIVLNPTVQAGPWEWWDEATVLALVASPQTGGNSGATLNGNSKATNPNMSAAKGKSYVDTLQGYFNPRIVAALSLTSGLGQLKNDLFSISKSYPNPTSGLLNLEINLTKSSDVMVKVLNTLGQIVLQKSITRYNSGISLIEIDLSSIANGVYLYTVEAENKVVSDKLIKQ